MFILYRDFVGVLRSFGKGRDEDKEENRTSRLRDGAGRRYHQKSKRTVKEKPTDFEEIYNLKG